MGPLSQNLKLIYNYNNEKAIAFAKEHGIHENNILKLISLYELSPQSAINAQSVAELLGITPRSASRILAKLLALDLIQQGKEDEGEFSEGKKKLRHGRPALHFHFVKDRFAETFLPEKEESS